MPTQQGPNRVLTESSADQFYLIRQLNFQKLVLASQFNNYQLQYILLYHLVNNNKIQWFHINSIIQNMYLFCIIAEWLYFFLNTILIQHTSIIECCYRIENHQTFSLKLLLQSNNDYFKRKIPVSEPIPIYLAISYFVSQILVSPAGSQVNDLILVSLGWKRV
ncbi:Hypothetical_protein [Hexamita inflata]|uniref:Hypothetical_protein n=1 Tax=Hexamita inflata TaxID=28002 RepID=A0AA86R4Q1_9EUKA|nr:Hypothetical protein HINF_LOCUS53469 [Hexamita inflata]